jgi:hypothetical protein
MSFGFDPGPFGPGSPPPARRRQLAPRGAGAGRDGEAR